MKNVMILNTWERYFKPKNELMMAIENIKKDSSYFLLYLINIYIYEKTLDSAND